MGTPSASQTGGIVSSFTGGAIPGALSVAWLPDKLGRKKTVFIGACIAVFGCALQGGARNIPMMIAGRFIAGISVGLLSAVVPMYCVSPSSELPLVFADSRLSPKSPRLKTVESSVVCFSGCCHGASLLHNGLATGALR
jgi:MFS family permease